MDMSQRERDTIALSGHRGSGGIHGGQLHVLGVRSIIGPPAARAREEGGHEPNGEDFHGNAAALSSLSLPPTATVFPDKLSLLLSIPHKSICMAGLAIVC